MKTLANYIKESIDKSQNSKNGHFEEFVDEETGELVTLWIEDKPEEIVKAVKEATPEELQKLKEMRKAFDKIDSEWWAVKDELDGAKDELKSLKSELRELQYGMEDEIGQATSDEERDKLGNQYGEELENVQNKIRNTITNMIICFSPSTEISKIPKTIPMKAPTKGISDIAPIIRAIVAAYGNLPMVRAAKNMNPSITASRHCPDRKFEKTL